MGEGRDWDREKDLSFEHVAEAEPVWVSPLGPTARSWVEVAALWVSGGDSV